MRARFIRVLVEAGDCILVLRKGERKYARFDAEMLKLIERRKEEDAMCNVSVGEVEFEERW